MSVDEGLLLLLNLLVVCYCLKKHNSNCTYYGCIVKEGFALWNRCRHSGSFKKTTRNENIILMSRRRHFSLLYSQLFLVEIM